MNVLPQFFYGMVVIGSLSMVGDGGGCEGRWEGVGLASGEGRPGSLIYRQIKSLHCSGYLLVVFILSPKKIPTLNSVGGVMLNLSEYVVTSCTL